MINRTLMLVETQNIVHWFNTFQGERIKELPIKIQWALLSGVKELQPAVSKFEEFRDGLANELQTEYFGNDDKSEPFEREKKNENGDTVYDDDGNPVVESLRRIKDEYVKEYEDKARELNAEINKLLIEKTTYHFKEIDLDAVIDNLKDDTTITLDDVNMMSFIDINSADKESE